ncbi:MAG: helix-turn-helix domain-containing protein [Lachnospiraceae bacterium]|nr:helix-turn-helix domain-containing protein [Lachnospiraceae bacterium]
MGIQFASTLKKLRTEKNLSQRELANKMYVTRSTIARWENGSRLPDITMITRLSQCLGENVNTLLNAASESDEVPYVILVDDTKITLTGGLPVLEDVLPNASVIGFTRPSEALDFAKAHRVAMAFLDIELGKLSGFDVCNSLLEINPRTNIIYVTAYSDYSLDAWSTGASGFMLKPITAEGVKEQLRKLRYPFNYGGVS